MRNVSGWCLVWVACLSLAALAQDEGQRDKVKPGGQLDRAGRAAQPDERAGLDREAPGAANRGAALQSDQQIAAFIYGGCRNHIEIAKFSQARLTDPQARQFAQKMVRDHTPGCEKLRELAGNLVTAEPGRGALERGAAPGRDIVPGARPEAAPPGRPGGARPEGPARVEPDADAPAEVRREVPGVEVEVRPGGRPGVAVQAGLAAGGQLNWVSIHQAIADQCLDTLKQELESHQGASFDQAYMGHEIMVHIKTIDELTVLKNHASPALRGDLDKSIQMARGHLREAKQIKEQLKGDGAAEPRVSRTPKSATPAAPKAKKE